MKAGKSNCYHPVHDQFIRRLARCLLAVCLWLTSIAPAFACGPDFSHAVMVNGLHPDLPLQLFSEGHLGIIQAGWAKSYLIVSYRYLSGIPLDAREQSSILKLWHERLRGLQSPAADDGSSSAAADPRVQYYQLRAETLGEKVKEGISRYDLRFADNVMDDAFLNASRNLRVLIKEFGDRSAPVKDWLAAQDRVFGAEYGTPGDPQPAAADASPVIKAQRAYQLAAAKFYANDMVTAKQLFEAMANDESCPWKDLAWYMAARATVKAAVDGQETDGWDAAEKYATELIARSPHSIYKTDLVDLVAALNYKQRSPSESLECLVKAVLQPHSERFGNNLGDLTYLLMQNLDASDNPIPQGDDAAAAASEFPIEKHDLTDWLTTIHQPDHTWSYLGGEPQKQLALLNQERGRHALDKWRQTHSLPWFVAALLCNDLLDKDNNDLQLAAAKVGPDSKAYLTAKFFVVDALLKSKHQAEADKILQEILAQKTLPPSSRNLFMCQRLLASRSVEEYLRNITQRPVAISFGLDPTQLPENWMNQENASSYPSCDAVIAETLVDDVNANLPQSYWLSWTKDTSLPRELRSHIILAAWLRSKLLGQNSGLDDALLNSFPVLKKLMAVYKAAPSGMGKRFALSWLIIKTWGMTPYLEAGILRHGANIGDWDGFNENFWLPLPPLGRAKPSPETIAAFDVGSDQNFYGADRMRTILRSYSQPILRTLLSAGYQKELEAERLAIWNNHPSSFLGEPILAWAKSHPHDPRIPEALYHLVKLPRWSSGRSEVGSKYSREAFIVLHKQYPNSSWTKQADYWY